jgi:hypothetical protein
VFGAAVIFLKLTESTPGLHRQVFQRLKEPFLTFLGSCCGEVAFVCLKHIQLLHQRDPFLFSGEFEQFYLRQNEPASVQVLKLQMLAEMASARSAWPIVAEMRYCTGHYDDDDPPPPPPVDCNAN